MSPPTAHLYGFKFSSTPCSWGGQRPLQLAQSRTDRWAQSPPELEGGPFTSPRPASLLTDGETEAQRGKWRHSPESSSDLPRPRP